MKEPVIIPESECMTCHYRMDAATSTRERQIPRPGDLSIWAKCATVTQFDVKLNMVPLSIAELDQLKKVNPKTYEMLRKAQTIIQARNKQN